MSCPQCGAAFEVRGDDPFVACGHCRASLFVDLGGLVRHLLLRPRIGAGEARGALERFLRAAEVDTVVAAPALRLEFHPWYVIPGDGGPSVVRGSSQAAFAAAPRRAAESGDAEAFDESVARTAEVVRPEISADEAVLQADGGRAEGVRLLHVPVWRIDFQEGGRRFRAYVDAVEGDVSTLALPPASSRRMDGVATAWLAGAIALFAIEAAVLPGVLWPVVAFVVTGTAAVQFVRLGERRRV
jgi:hypothetical protein